MLVHARHEVVGELLPAVADIDAGQFQPRQQRHRADLVLRIPLPHAPDMGRVMVEHARRLALLDHHQRQVPPVVRQHEGIQVGPGVLHLLEKGPALRVAALGQQHMGERVMRPRLLAPAADRVVRGTLGLAEQMALLVGEGDHAVGVGEVVVVRQHRGADSQHPRRVAEIEAVVLGDLGECQVAREMRGRMRASASARGMSPSAQARAVATVSRSRRSRARRRPLRGRDRAARAPPPGSPGTATRSPRRRWSARSRRRRRPRRSPRRRASRKRGTPRRRHRRRRASPRRRRSRHCRASPDASRLRRRASPPHGEV